MLRLHKPTPHPDHPIYWFVVMEDAKERGDFETAAVAKKALERLGVFVTYRPKRTVSEVVFGGRR